MVKFAERMDGLTGSAIREILAMAGKPGMISFAGGLPAKETFPTEDVAEITARLMAEQGGAVLQYGATVGWPALLESIAQRLNGKGIAAEPSDIITLTGSCQGIELMAKIFLNPGDVVLVENPTFLGALQTFRTYKGVPVGVEMDENGVILEDLEEKIRTCHPKLIYLIPTFQNPTGRTMPEERRAKVAELARKYDVIVIEDDPYGELRYAGAAPKALKCFDTDGHVVLLNSFSKIISPGLRVGYAMTTKEILAKMNIAKQGMDTHTSNLSQAVVDAYLRSGKLPGHIEECCGNYAGRMEDMLCAMAKYLPEGTSWTHPEGGLFIWATLPQGTDARAAFAKAVERDVAFVPGEHFFADLSGKNTLRLNFSASTPEEIDHGMRVLGEVFSQMA